MVLRGADALRRDSTQARMDNRTTTIDGTTYAPVGQPRRDRHGGRHFVGAFRALDADGNLTGPRLRFIWDALDPRAGGAEIHPPDDSYPIARKRRPLATSEHRPNPGNSASWLALCVRIGPGQEPENHLADQRGRIRRFSPYPHAEKAARKAGYSPYPKPRHNAGVLF